MSQEGNFPRRLANACDFCSQGSFVKAYACHSFVYWKGTEMECHSAQEWSACATCAALIDGKQWRALTNRAVIALARSYGLSCSEIPLFREQIDQLHGAFRRHVIAES